jgi:ribonuclease J
MEDLLGKKIKSLKVFALGGLEEIGKNLTVFEYEKDIIIVDCGLAFPTDDMLGIDIVIPDITYLIENEDRIRGVIVTHGHEDHIGAIPYLLKQINTPVYATGLALGLIDKKIEEHKLTEFAVLNEVNAGEKLNLGVFEIEFIRTVHSIPDSVALAIKTPMGMIIHTSDFKIDYTPIHGEPINLGRFAELGQKGVRLLLCESTNVENPGFSLSEKIVGDTFQNIFVNTKGRIIVATFASNVHRIQQVIDAAVRFKRKVAVIGRSMLNVIQVAKEKGYLKIPEDTIIDIGTIKNYRKNKLVILSTGSQGEPMSALTRMATSALKQMKIEKDDLVIISAKVIPGNEKMVNSVINDLFKKGAEVIYESLKDIHVSGHACREELKIIHKLVNPEYFVPIHGEYRHLKKHQQLAQEIGMDRKNIFLLENGEVLSLSAKNAQKQGTVASGQVFVDGLGVGDVGNIVIRDRKHLAEDGIIAVIIAMEKESNQITGGPDIMTRGFIHVKESEEVMEELKNEAEKYLYDSMEKYNNDWQAIKNKVRKSLRNYIYNSTKRNPMVMVIVMEV